MAHKIKVGKDIDQAWQKAVAVRERAYAIYSKFKVGAALIDDRGQVVVGCNVENASFGATVCAERNAMFRAIADGAKSIADVVVVTEMDPPAGPCALCLQVLCEFAQPDTRVWLADPRGIRERVALKALLPRHFGPNSFPTGR